MVLYPQSMSRKKGEKWVVPCIFTILVLLVPSLTDDVQVNGNVTMNITPKYNEMPNDTATKSCGIQGPELVGQQSILRTQICFNAQHVI